MNYICEYCGKAHDGSYGSGRFCSHTCQAKWARLQASKRAAHNKTLKAQLKHMQLNNTACICEKCGISYIRKNGVSFRFCSRACANSRTHTQQTKEKIASSVRNYVKSKPPNVNKPCKCCGKPVSKGCKSGYCKKCFQQTPEYKDKIRRIQLELVANGTHKGWRSRNITSYAERFFKSVLDNNKIKYKRELHVGKYFLDFVVDDIDIEIDGKQHQYVERKISDIERDDYLRKQGYFVYRIRWNEINTISGKQMMKDKIDCLLDFLDAFT